MNVLEYYALFALTTAIVAVYELYMPYSSAVGKGINTSSYYIGMFTFFVLALLAAPAMLAIVITPSKGERFRTVFHKELDKHSNIKKS